VAGDYALIIVCRHITLDTSSLPPSFFPSLSPSLPPLPPSLSPSLSPSLPPSLSLSRDGSAVELVGLCYSAVTFLGKLNQQSIYPHSGVRLSAGNQQGT
jgi:hypothetical protein